MGYDITIYRHVSCDITPNYLETPGKYKQIQQKPTTSLQSALAFFGFVSTLILACLPSGFFVAILSSIIGLTVPPANSILVPSGLGLLPEGMFVFVFIFHFFSFLSFPFFFLLDTRYVVLLSSCEVPDILLLLT